jgi:hypothetical protein
MTIAEGEDGSLRKCIPFESKMIDGSERLGRRACESGSGG